MGAPDHSNDEVGEVMMQCDPLRNILSLPCVVASDEASCDLVCSQVMGLACEALGGLSTGKRRQGNASGAGRVNTLQGRWWNRVPIPTGQGGCVRRNRLFMIKGTQYVVLSVFKKKYNKWLEVEEALATDDANVHGHVVTKGVLGRWQWKTLARGHGLTSAQVAAALTVEVKASKVESWGSNMGRLSHDVRHHVGRRLLNQIGTLTTDHASDSTLWTDLHCAEFSGAHHVHCRTYYM
eukprot:jgi/Mesvir1/7174/Mv25958-RA.1